MAIAASFLRRARREKARRFARKSEDLPLALLDCDPRGFGHGSEFCWSRWRSLAILSRAVYLEETGVQRISLTLRVEIQELS